MESLTITPTQSRRDTAEATLGCSIHWTDADTGFLDHCPGEHLHTHRSGKRDCQIKLSGAPTIHCFHTSCAGSIAEANWRLRSAIGKAERGGAVEQWTPNPEQLRERKKLERHIRYAARLERRATDGLRSILSTHQISEQDFRNLSPYSLDQEPAGDWRLHLRLWEPDAVVWVGNVYDSGGEHHAANFRTCEEWLKLEQCPGNFTCPATFKNSSISRSNQNVISRPFLVVESDPQPEKNTGLNRDEMRALFQWMRSFLRLRAVVDTGGKSLHGWFEYPPEASLIQLKAILPAIGCDPALFKAAQPCRLPGAWRSEKNRWQRLIWLDPKGGNQ